MNETEKLKKIRELCTCGMHGTGLEYDDTPENRQKLEACPSRALAGPPETRYGWMLKNWVAS